MSLQESLINQIGQVKDGNNYLMQAIMFLLLHTLQMQGEQKIEEKKEEAKEYTIDQAFAESEGLKKIATGQHPIRMIPSPS